MQFNHMSPHSAFLAEASYGLQIGQGAAPALAHATPPSTKQHSTRERQNVALKRMTSD
jgi:hypothetical protein